MSTGVSEHQRNKGQGNSGNQSYGKNSGKDHHAGDHEENDSWRNQQGHHQGYGSSMNSEPYMPSYYGSFQQYPTYGVNEAGGPWSTNGGGDMGFVGGGGYHESSGGPGGAHYNVDGMFGGGNGGGGGGGYGNFGGGQGQPNFGYGGFHGGNGDYNAWGPQSRKHYDEYYRDGMYADDRMKMVEQGMGGLGLGNDKEMKDFKEMMTSGGGGGGSKKTTWASIASQPAKPQSISKKTKPGMPPPPMIPGAWESKNGVVAKAPIAAPVQAPAWERPKVPPPVQPPPVQQPHPPPQSHAPPPHGNHQNIPPSRGYQQHQPMGYNMPPAGHQPPPPMIQHNSHSSHSSQNSQPPPPSTNHSNGNYSSPPPASPPGPKYPDEMKMKDYNPTSFDLLAEGSRFFVIKSYSEDDIHRSIKYEIWCSTEHGNKRLDEAFREREGKGPIYLFFSVNGSGHFCGMAQMISSVDYHASSSVWSQDKWKGQFKVKWIYVKDVPNPALRHIRLENNENKPVTNSRDTQEVPVDKGRQVLKIMHTFLNTTSIFDDFIHYEKRQEEEEVQRKVVQQPPPPPPDMRGHRGGGGRGGFHDRGGFHGGNPHPGNNSRERGERDRPDRDFGGRENPRDFRDHRGGGRDGFGMHPRNDRMDNRDHYNSRDRGDRDSFRDDRDGRDSRDTRDRGDSRDHHRGGGRGMGRPPMRREMN